MNAMKFSGKMVLTLVVVFAAASVVNAALVIDDHFNDGALGTNTLGTGTGFTFVDQGGGGVVESGTVATITGGQPSRLIQLYSNDAFTLTDPITVTFVFSNLDLAASVGNPVRMGLSPNNTDDWFYGQPGKLSFATESPIGSDIDISSGLTGGATTLELNLTSTTYEMKQGSTILASGGHTLAGNAYVTVGYQSGDSNYTIGVDRIVVGDPVAIPEPGTLALLAAALVGLLAYAWRKRK